MDFDQIRFAAGRVLSLLALLFAWPALGAEPWAAPVGPDGVTRIIVEAEDLAGVDATQFGGNSPGWRVGRAGMDHYQCNTFGGHWQSRTRTAMTDAGDNPAALTADLEVPKAGKYKLWVKYECPPFFNYAFTVALSQPGQATPLFQQTCGLLDAPKHFSFSNKLVQGSLYWAWGIDHDAAEGYVVELPAGKLRLTLAKTKNPAPAGMRSLDVIMLTDDLSDLSSPRFPRYPLLDELRRGNHVFVRFRLNADAPGPARLAWGRWGKRYNDFYHPDYTNLVRFYGLDGALMLTPEGKPLVAPNGQLAAPLKPGETSPWLDVGPTLNTESAATFACSATVLDEAGKPLALQPPVVVFHADVALVPDAAKVVKTFSVKPGETGGQLTFLLQPDLRTAEGLRWSMVLADAYRYVTTELDRTPRQAPMPKRMRFYGWTSAPLLQNEPWSWEVAMDFRRAQGLNTVFGSALSLTPADYDKQQAWCKERGFGLLRSAAFHHSQDVEDVARKVQALGTAGQFYYLSYGDEIGLPDVDAQKPEVIVAFHEHLKRQGLTPESLGLGGWDQVKPLATPSAEVAVQIGVVPAGRSGEAVAKTIKRLYWHSCRFRVERGIADFAQKTRRFRELLGTEVHTSANLGGMHPFYWMHQSSFIESFKHQAMSMAWTEDYDYCQPETSRLVVEFQAGYLKAGAKYHQQRMMFYCMPHYPGNSPEHLLQNAVLEWGQNVKDLDWFCTCPDGFTTENYVNVRDGLPMFRALRRASEMAGAVEDWLEPATPVPTPVALLLSEASDTWEVGGLGQWAVTPGAAITNAFQEERKNTYYVLRNAGYRVDLLTEADVQQGYLKPYRALYVGGQNLERATAKVLTAWVAQGGLLYAAAGAARRDEYDEPLTALDDVLGRGPRVAWEPYRGALRSKLELLFLKPLDVVKLGDGRTFEALAAREKFTAIKEATVLATYGDGTPAMVSRKTGAGVGYYVGTMPGEAWAKKALPVLPCGKGGPENATRYPQFEPTDFDAVAGAVVLRPLQDAAIMPDVGPSRPNIVCNRLAGPPGTVVTVVNLGATQHGAATAVTLSIAGIAKPAKVWSYAYPQGLTSDLKDGILAVQLPELGLADIVVLEGVR